MRRFLIVLLPLFLTACATGYHPRGWTGGYSELQLSDDVFQVEFDGNGRTRASRAADFSLLRCAELAIEKGYTYFIVVDKDQSTHLSTVTTPQATTTTGSVNTYGSGGTVSATTTTTGGQTYIVSKPSAVNTIVCFREKPEDYPTAFKAEMVRDNLRAKYGMNEKDAEN